MRGAAAGESTEGRLGGSSEGPGGASRAAQEDPRPGQAGRSPPPAGASRKLRLLPVTGHFGLSPAVSPCRGPGTCRPPQLATAPEPAWRRAGRLTEASSRTEKCAGPRNWQRRPLPLLPLPPSPNLLGSKEAASAQQAELLCVLCPPPFSRERSRCLPSFSPSPPVQLRTPDNDAVREREKEREERERNRGKERGKRERERGKREREREETEKERKRERKEKEREKEERERGKRETGEERGREERGERERGKRERGKRKREEREKEKEGRERRERKEKERKERERKERKRERKERERGRGMALLQLGWAEPNEGGLGHTGVLPAGQRPPLLPRADLGQTAVARVGAAASASCAARRISPRGWKLRSGARPRRHVGSVQLPGAVASHGGQQVPGPRQGETPGERLKWPVTGRSRSFLDAPARGGDLPAWPGRASSRAAREAPPGPSEELPSHPSALPPAAAPASNLLRSGLAFPPYSRASRSFPPRGTLPSRFSQSWQQASLSVERPLGEGAPQGESGEKGPRSAATWREATARCSRGPQPELSGGAGLHCAFRFPVNSAPKAWGRKAGASEAPEAAGGVVDNCEHQRLDLPPVPVDQQPAVTLSTSDAEFSLQGRNILIKPAISLPKRAANHRSSRGVSGGLRSPETAGRGEPMCFGTY
ncbi:MEF2-activating motif and SAP domain-containing transcriptional regulator [Crotalus adamanteus]|uniref:MEF2-activating motif and SAP domain-containing transcriptional regulator n=1 Tax=Crotalus adamanteus TaxID=8729 RepID=A0AAW1B1E0_CROAD